MNGARPRWLLAVAAVLIQLCLGAGYSWSVFRLPIQHAYGWSYSATAEPFRHLLLAYTVGMTLGGLLQDRYGPRFIAGLGGVLVGAGCVLGAMVGQSPLGMVAGYAWPAGLGMGFAYQPALAVLVKWFPDRRGLIVGLAVMGFGAGPLLSAPIQTAMLGASPAAYASTIPRTFLAMAAVFVVVVVGLAQLLRNPPDGWRPEGWEPPPQDEAHEDFSVAQMLATWQFYALWAILLFSTSIGLAAISEAAPYLERLPATDAWLGVGASVGVMGLCNGLGRLLSGALSDSLGRPRTILAVFALDFLACVLLQGASGYPRGFLGLCLAGLGFGAGIALMPSSNADYFGARNIGGNYGVMFTGFALSGFVVPLWAARTVEAAAGRGNVADGYRAVFWALAAVAAAGFLLAAALRPPRRTSTS